MLKSLLDKGFTLIEILLVLVVASLILVLAVGQYQRYQSARDLELTKNGVNALSYFSVQLFNESCTDMYAPMMHNTGYVKQAVCPDSARSYVNTSQMGLTDSQCASIKIPNPWVRNSNNYSIQIIPDQYHQNFPVILIGFPVSSAIVGSSTASTVNNNPVLQKYVGALQPSRVVFKNSNTAYIPGKGTASVSNDVCTAATGQPACFEWEINSLNWGSMSTSTVNNQTAATELQAAYGNYTFMKGAQPDNTFTCASVMNYLIQNKTCIDNCS